ncbi:MAG: redoxin domain-containing protein [Chthonomonadaceae bacterium]|nr:redoxin domain-containing protein [Chthonomonadaceae bacterium]
MRLITTKSTSVLSIGSLFLSPLFLSGCGQTRTPITVQPAVSLASKQAKEVKADDPNHPAAPEFAAGLDWLNTEKSVSIKDLKGKFVLLDFWTYCCINCIHAIPTLKNLEHKYANNLAVIGVHSGKFDNEKDSRNIRDAVLRYELEHPVVNDKDYKIWKSYGVNAWPTLVLIDPEGNVIGSASGEPDYALFDRIIGEKREEFRKKNLLNEVPIKWALERDKKPKTLLNFPGKIITDPVGNRLIFSDSNNNRIVIASLTGAVQTVIGGKTSGLVDGDFTTAKFFRPQGLAFDAARNSIYVADTENHAIRKINLTTKIVSTLAGNGKQAQYPPTGGMGKGVSLSSPWDVLQRGNTLYIAMAGLHQLWTLDLETAVAEPFAGTGGENIVDGERKRAQFAQPSGLTTDGKFLYVADSEVSAVRSVNLATGAVKTLVGKGLFDFGDVDGAPGKARFQHPLGVTYKGGALYVADAYNHKIRKLDLTNRNVSTLIGTGKRGSADSSATISGLNEPNGVAWSGNQLFIADTNNSLIRVFDVSTGQVKTLTFTGLK